MSNPKEEPISKHAISDNPTEPLQRYFDCLNFFALRVVKKVDKSTDLDLPLVKNLIGQGCLAGSDSSSYDGLAFTNVSITPQGAVVLAEWASLLRASSVKGQLMETLGKLVWLFAGMFITLSGALLLTIIK